MDTTLLKNMKGDFIVADKLAFSISVSAGTGEWLDAFAARMGTTRNSAINFILRMGIDAYEEATSRINTTMKEGANENGY